MSRKYKEIVDLYAMARFGSLWAVVEHATGPDENRHSVYAEAEAAMIATHQWRDYRMQFHTLPSGTVVHVGFRYARAGDWFLRDNENHTTEGPFVSKKRILSKLGARTSRKTEVTGVYTVGYEFTLFTRERADILGLDPETLP